MKRTTTTKIRGWQFTFTKNIHMYCHALTAERANIKLEIPCEDLPKNERVGIWLEDVDLHNKEELVVPLLEWANEMNIFCDIYSGEETHSNHQ